MARQVYADNLEVFYKERISPILISTLEELKPIDWDNSIYGY